MVIKTASPGVVVNEVDLTRGTSDAITTNVGGFVGPFLKGPVGELVLIETEAELQRTFGGPTDENFEYWYTVSNFLEYGGVCYVIRCDDATGDAQTMKNAAYYPVGTVSPIPYVKNEDDFNENFLLAASALPGPFVAKTPGEWANGIGIAVIDSGADYEFTLPTLTGTTSADFNIKRIDPSGGTNPASSTVFDKTQFVGDVPVNIGTYQLVEAISNANPEQNPKVGDWVKTVTLNDDTVADSGKGYVMSIDATGDNIIYQIILTTQYPFTVDSNFKLINAAGQSTQAITAVETEGNYEYYSHPTQISTQKIAAVWVPDLILRIKAQELGWETPAKEPRDGTTKKTALGQTYSYNSSRNVWVAQYTPVDGDVDMVTDGIYVFPITLAVNWYEQQIAFQGIPWTRFASRPTSTQNALDRGAFNDAVNVIVYDSTGNVTGSKGNTLIQFAGASKFKDGNQIDGSNNYYVHLINNFANSIYASGADLLEEIQDGSGGINSANAGVCNAAVGSTVSNGSVCKYVSVKSYILTGGVNNLTATLGEIQVAYDTFTTESVEDLDYILQGPSGVNVTDSIAKANFIISIVEERRDCMAFISPPRADVVGQSDPEKITESIERFADELTSSSYAVFDSGYKYMYDRYNDEYRYVPLNADIAGCMVRASVLSEPWYSPAGVTRGQILNVVKLAFNPTKAQRDILYSARVNSVVSFPGEGTILFGDKTALAYSSAFDRINVRKLFLILEKEIARIAKTNLFEFNDEITRALFKNNVNPFLRDVQSKRGMTDFLVVCDSSNNPPEIIDRNEFVSDIYIKPARSINFITLNFIATKTGVTFDESIALFRRTGA